MSIAFAKGVVQHKISEMSKKEIHLLKEILYTIKHSFTHVHTYIHASCY